jgi:UDPglucose 6-dehydrogenase
MTVGVIGYGVIGQAQERMLRKAGVSLVIYDPAYPEYVKYPHAELASCDLAVICVSTPPDEYSANRQNVHNVVAAYEQLPPRLPTVIRSTVVPGMTDWLRTHRDRGALTAHVPEFLQERSGGDWPESTDVPYLILGGSREAQEFFMPWLQQVRGKQAIHLCSALEAELAKYTANLYWASRVTFVNELAGICRAYGADWEEVRRAWLRDSRVGAAYTRLEGFPPGFGGSCWPKDLDALIMAAADNGYVPEFLKDIREANARFRA